MSVRPVRRRAQAGRGISGGAGSFLGSFQKSGGVRAGGVQVESKPLQARGVSPMTA